MKINKIFDFLRIVLLFIGGVLTQFIITKKTPFLIHFTFAGSLEKYFRFGSLNLDNVILGFILWFFLVSKIYQYFRKTEKKIYNEIESDSELSVGFHEKKYFRNQAQFILTVFTFFSISTAVFLIGIIVKDKWQKQNIPNFPYIYFLALILGAISFYVIDKLRGKTQLFLEKKDGLVLLIILAISVFLLGYNLRFPREWVADEAASWATVRSILRGENKTDIFSYGYYSYPVFNAFLQAGIIKLFHLENLGVAGWRFASIPIALTVIFGVYLFCLQLFSRKVAIISSLILLVNPYFMILSRVSIPTNQSMIPPLFTIFLLYTGFRNRSYFLCFLAGIFSGFGFYVYPPGKVAILIGGVYSAYIFFNNTKNRRESLILSAIFIFSFLLTASPILAHSIFVDPVSASDKFFECSILNTAWFKSIYSDININKLAEYFPLKNVHSRYIIYFHPIILRFFFRNLFVSVISFFHPAVIFNLNFISSMVGYEWGFFTFLGLVFVILKIFKRDKTDKFISLFIWFSLILIILGAFFGDGQFWRIEPILPILAIFSGITVALIYSYLESLFGEKISLLITSVILLSLCLRSYYNYFNVMHYGPAESQLIDVEIANAVNDADKDELVIYLYKSEEEVRHGGGMNYDYMHLYDTRHQLVPIDKLENELNEMKSNINKYVFFYEDKNFTEKLHNIFQEKGSLQSVLSENKEKVLFYKYEVRQSFTHEVHK